MATIKIPAVKSTEVISKVTFEDGVVIQVAGANNATTRKPLYLEAKANPTEQPAIIPPPIIIIPPTPDKPREIGNKELAQLKDVQNEVFNLKPGVYTDRCDFTNLKNVSIDGLGKVQFQTGRRAIQFNGTPPSGVKLNGLSFKDIDDYCIDFWGFGGSLKPIEGFSFTNITAYNTGAVLHIDGGLDSGLVEDLIIDKLTFINSKQPRSAVYVGNAKNYSISNCVVDNINYERNFYENGQLIPNGTHNGIFQMGGWGKFFNNKITNHQGNALRAWLFGGGTVEIFNNIVFNSWKYGAFELQNPMNGKPANAKVYNNTVGRMNNSKDWEGQVLDVYNYGGTLEFFNNLGFELVSARPITGMLNNMSDTKIVRMDGNVYKDKSQDAVTDLVSFKSKVAGVGANL